MDKETYDEKRRELYQRYPVYLSKRWLRNVRIAFSVLILIGVKLTQSTLPVFDITCLHDNVLAWFSKYQPTPDSALIQLWLQVFLLMFVISIAAAALNWFLVSDSLRPPLAVLLFYLAKFFSDTSLVLHRPWKVLWPEMKFLGIEISANSFFFSNVCPFTGLLVLNFLFSYSIENWILRKSFCGFTLLAFGVSSAVQLTFQLVHSFAIFSGIICAIFAFLVSKELEPFIEKKVLGDQDPAATVEPVEKVEAFESVEAMEASKPAECVGDVGTNSKSEVQTPQPENNL